MKKTLIALVALILVGPSFAEDSAIDPSQGCWKDGGEDDRLTNTITICVEGKWVKATIFYPNNGDDSTTCRSMGRIESISVSKFEIKLQQGTCENTRTLGDTDLDCTLLNDRELNCLDRSFNQLRFMRDATVTIEQ